jgi:hypothetical protein
MIKVMDKIRPHPRPAGLLNLRRLTSEIVTMCPQRTRCCGPRLHRLVVREGIKIPHEHHIDARERGLRLSRIVLECSVGFPDLDNIHGPAESKSNPR